MFSLYICPPKLENFHLMCESFTTILKVKLMNKTGIQNIFNYYKAPPQRFSSFSMIVFLSASYCARKSFWIFLMYRKASFPQFIQSQSFSSISFVFVNCTHENPYQMQRNSKHFLCLSMFKNIYACFMIQKCQRHWKSPHNFSRPWLSAMASLCKLKFMLLVPILTSDRKDTICGVPQTLWAMQLQCEMSQPCP